MSSGSYVDHPELCSCALCSRALCSSAHSASSLKPILCFFGHMGARQGAGHHRYMQASTRDRLSQKTAKGGAGAAESESRWLRVQYAKMDAHKHKQPQHHPPNPAQSVSPHETKNELINLKRHLQLARRADPHIESARQRRATHAASCGRTCKPQHAKRILVRSRVSA